MNAQVQCMLIRDAQKTKVIVHTFIELIKGDEGR